MPLVLLDSTIAGNTAIGEESNNLMNFTKVMLRQDVDPTQTHSDADGSGGAGRDVLVGGRGGDSIDAGGGKSEFGEFTITKMVDGTDGAPGDLVGTSGGDAGEPAGNSSGYAGSHALYQDVFVPAASEPTPYLHYKLDRVFVTSWSGSAEQDAFDFKAMDTSAATSSYAGALVVDPVNPAADSGTTAHTFTITISNPTSADAFAFKAMEAGEIPGTHLPSVTDMVIDSFDTGRLLIGDGGDGGWLFGNGGKGGSGPASYGLYVDGKDNLATFEPDTDGGHGGAGGLLFGTGGAGIPVTMAEYGLMIA